MQSRETGPSAWGSHPAAPRGPHASGARAAPEPHTAQVQKNDHAVYALHSPTKANDTHHVVCLTDGQAAVSTHSEKKENQSLFRNKGIIRF